MKTRAEAERRFIEMFVEVLPVAQKLLSEGKPIKEVFELLAYPMMPVVIDFFDAKRRSERARHVAEIALKFMPRLDTPGQQPAERRAVARLAVEQVALVLDEAELYIEGETLEGEAN